MEKVIYNKNGGLGVILDAQDCVADTFDTVALEVGTGTLSPNDYTTLFGLFKESVEYVGTLKNEDFTIMCFHLGDEDTAESPKKYYSCIYWISPTRLANKYSIGSNVRDFHFKDGKFK